MILKVQKLSGGSALVNTDFIVCVEEHKDMYCQVNGCSIFLSRAASGSWNELSITETVEQLYALIGRQHDRS